MSRISNYSNLSIGYQDNTKNHLNKKVENFSDFSWMYKPMNDLILANCPAGSYCPIQSKSPLRQKIQCPAGSYCPIGSKGITQCPAGSYCPIGSTGITQCPAGSYCPTPSQKIDCQNGYYCPSGSSTVISTCPYGYYCPTPSQKIECSTGYYCPKAGLTSQTICSTGYYCPSTSQQISCQTGYYCASTGLTTQIECPTGFYCPSTSQQIQCSPTSYCRGNKLTRAPTIDEALNNFAQNQYDIYLKNSPEYITNSINIIKNNYTSSSYPKTYNDFASKLNYLATQGLNSAKDPIKINRLNAIKTATNMT